MKGRGSSCGASWVAGLLILGSLAPRAASAQQWHELYQGGVAALRDGQVRKAVDLLSRAIEKRPQPGVRVPTYGTNFEPQYYPYLRLAEAHLRLGAAEDAAAALETSLLFGVEPAEERAALETRVRAALEAKRPKEEPTPTPTPTPPPTSTPPPASASRPGATEQPATTEASDPGSRADSAPPRPAEPTTPAPEPQAASETSASPVATARSAERRRASAPTPAATQVPPTRPARPWLDITSDPPGARVFLDDEPVGRTDPETGRLRLRELGSGRHRLRFSSEDRDDLIREVEIGGESVSVEAVLPPREPVSPETPAQAPARPTPVGLAVLGVVVVTTLLAGLWVWRAGRTPVARGDTPRSGEPRRDSGSGEIFPAPFGDYTLLRRIGKGGMAVVYEATRGGETFALKRPLTGFLDDDRFRERFLREAELGRALHHPNIIRIFDRGQVGAVPFFVMELVRGETLRDRLDRDGRLDAALAARVTARVAEALDYAHNKGVIHRDLKPSNIMLEHSGGVKVMDYGVARAQRLEGLTTTGSFLGTPSYAAPETVDAGSGPQSDIYSLGVVFFEMLTGSLPFRGESAFAVLRGHASTPPPAPSSLNYALPEEIDRLVLRLLSKDPAERPTAEALLNEIADFLGSSR